MSKLTSKHRMPKAFVLALGIVSVLAILAAFAVQPSVTQAQGVDCDTNPFAAFLAECQNGTPTTTPDPDPGTTPAPTPDPMDDGTACGSAADACTKSDSTSGSGSPEIQLIIERLAEPVQVGSSIVLYLEDDYAEPSSISASSVYLVVTRGDTSTTGDGGRVYVTNTAKIKTGAYFDADKKDISIRVLVPDMCPDSTDGCEGQDGLQHGSDGDAGGRVRLRHQEPVGSRQPQHRLRDPAGPTGKIPSKATAEWRPLRRRHEAQ